LAAFAALGAITVLDWLEQMPPDEYMIMPYLPDIIETTDWQYIYSMTAPRLLLLAETLNRAQWPEEGYKRVRSMAEDIYWLHDASSALSLVTIDKSPWLTDGIRKWLRVNLQ